MRSIPDHAYQACRNTIDYVANRWNAKVNIVKIPFPIEHKSIVLQNILDCVTDRTVLAMIDTVTSPTGLRMLFEEITNELRGIEVLSMLLTALEWYLSHWMNLCILYHK